MQTNSNRYAKNVEVSKRIRREIDRDVIRDRQFDFSKKFLLGRVSRADKVGFLNVAKPCHGSCTPSQRKWMHEITRTTEDFYGIATHRVHVVIPLNSHSVDLKENYHES